MWAAAMARHKSNLHTPFGEGDLAYLLGRPVDGVHVPMATTRLSNLIKELRDRGLLAAGSGQRCLVLPAAHFDCDLPGAHEPCAWHHTRVSRPKKSFVATRHEKTLRGSDADVQVSSGAAVQKFTGGMNPIHSGDESSQPQLEEAVA